MSISMQDTIQPVSRHARPLREALEPGEEGLLTRIVIDRAKCGDAAALRFVLGQLYPRPRGRAIVLDLPAEVRSGNVVAVFDATLEAMTEGRITPEEARSVILVLDGRLRVLAAWEREQRLMWRDRFVPGGLVLPEKPVFRWDGDADEDKDEPDPPGFAAAWGRYQAMLADYERKCAEITAKGGTPANHLHPQAPPPGEGEAGRAQRAVPGAADLHSACIRPDDKRQRATGAALRREFVAVMSGLPDAAFEDAVLPSPRGAEDGRPASDGASPPASL
jgi:hypothetical protein